MQVCCRLSLPGHALPIWLRLPDTVHPALLNSGSVSVRKIEGKKVTKLKDIEVGGLPEAALFTPDGKYILVGNYLSQDFSTLKVDGTSLGSALPCRGLGFRTVQSYRSSRL